MQTGQEEQVCILPYGSRVDIALYPKAMADYCKRRIDD
jgi:hypothetical protein